MDKQTHTTVNLISPSYVKGNIKVEPQMLEFELTKYNTMVG